MDHNCSFLFLLLVACAFMISWRLPSGRDATEQNNDGPCMLCHTETVSVSFSEPVNDLKSRALKEMQTMSFVDETQTYLLR